MPTFVGWTSLTLSRFVFSFAYTCLGIVSGFWLAFCVFRYSNTFFFTCPSILTCDHVLRHDYVGLPFPPFARVLDRRYLLFVLTRLHQWFMLALTHPVCVCCPFLFFHSNTCGHDVSGIFPATRGPKSCIITPPRSPDYLLLLLLCVTVPMRVHSHP